MRRDFIGHLRDFNGGRRGLLGFPLWLPVLLGVLLFLAGHLLAGERHHPQRPAHTASRYLSCA